ncbi:hypothetical protein PAMP_003947 [Pampus punctatissimus]
MPLHCRHRDTSSSLKNICQAVSSSTSERKVNIHQLVCDETGQVFGQSNIWHSFLSFKPLLSVNTVSITTSTSPVQCLKVTNMEEEPSLSPLHRNHLALVLCVSALS